MRASIVLASAVLAMGAATASAQWSDNFDSYPLGSLDGLGGWQGWDNVSGVAGTVSNVVAHSGPNSHEISGSTDSVHQYTGVDAGRWRYTAWQYIPVDYTGDTYFILNNVYNNGGPYNWFVQMFFQSSPGTTTGQIIDDFRPENQVFYVRGEWAQIRINFDIDANTIEEYYNDQLIASGVFLVGGGTYTLGGVDLYANGATSVYYDDISLEFLGSTCSPCAADYNLDGGVDGADVAAFFPDWEASGGCADINQDGGIDGSDVESFFLLWEAGGC